MSPSIRLSFSSLLLGLALLVAACGGGSTVTAGGGDSVTPTSGQPGDPSATATPTPTPSPTLTPAGDEEALAQLAQARERWAEAGIEDYAYSISESCECPDEISGPRRVTVKAGEVVSTTWFGQPATFPGVTIDQLFDEIEAQLSRPDTQNDLRFDEVTGVPVGVSLDEVAQAVDGGRAFQVHDFVSHSDLRTQLAQARDRWEDAGIDDYTLTYDWVCFCPQIQIEVTVVAGEIVASEVRSEIENVGLDPQTVPDLFDTIEAAIDDGAFNVSVQYDAQTGHPTGYFVDVEEMMADEEFGIGNVVLTPG